MRYKLIVFLALLSNGICNTPPESLKLLLEGNERYVGDKLLHPNRSLERREEIASKQKPFATIVGCSDSRVAPEIIFDQGLGDLFVVRVAGNVVGPVELDSIEYSVKYLGSSLVLVLGHESCGAITAVMEGETADIEDVADLIKPAIKGAKTVEEAIKANVRAVVAGLKKTSILKGFISKKKVECIGAYYNLDTGHVEIL
ncbi:MAG: carbonic anhydrase [Chlamydiae bacterium RIFCSPHIGHO2_12_FULL_49_9]|nr:MAG: carbonic anhydrase [Chlamydiae bacterium RIFCSPHIGHO2_12_FULL_49_9]